MIKFRPLRALYTLFGYEQGYAPRTRMGDTDIGPEFPGSGEAIYKWFQNQTDLAQDRMQRYREFDAVDTNDILNSALDLYAEDAVRQDSCSGRVVWVASKNQEIEQIANQTLRNAHMDERAFEIVRSMIKYGDHFEAVLQGLNDQDLPVKMVGTRPVMPYWVSREEDNLGRLRGFKLGLDGSSNENTKGVDGLGTAPGEGTLMPWEMVHFKLPGKEPSSTYGTSILFSSRRIFRMLNMMEEALCIYRIKRAPSRLKWSVDTGGAPAEESAEILNLFMQRVKKKMLTDPETGEIKQEQNPWALDDDIYIPTGEDMHHNVELLKGDGPVGNIVDVDYMRKRLFSCLRIPPDYMGYEDSSGSLNSSTPLADQDVRYSKTIKRIQKAFMVGVTQLVHIDLAIRGIDVSKPENEFRVVMQPVSYLEEQQQAEVAKNRASIVSDLLTLGSELGINQTYWVDYVGRLSGFPEEVISAITHSNTDTQSESIREAVEQCVILNMRNPQISSNYCSLNFDMPDATSVRGKKTLTEAVHNNRKTFEEKEKVA